MIEGRAGRWLGALFVIQFVVVCGIKTYKGVAPEILWMSHTSLLCAGVGLLARSRFLVGTAYVAIFCLHTMWLVDCLTLIVTGRSPLAITAYLAEADRWSWVATSHHFYLAPALAVAVYRVRSLPATCLLGAVAMYMVLTVVCRAVSPRGLNVNYAYGVGASPRWELIDRINLLPDTVYLLVLNAGVALLFFLPAFAGIRLLMARRRVMRDGAQPNA